MIGETIGRFELRTPLGAGPYGEVWLAGHRETQAAVAIKLLHAELSTLAAVTACIAAVRAIARVANAWIAPVLDAGVRADGRVYIVGELVLGQTLAQRIAQGRLSQTQAADLVGQIARALIAAHGVGVCHHDLKPSNVMLVPDGERPTGERAVVLDFGLGPLVAARRDRAAAAYLAPEQWADGDLAAAAPGPAADVYALGCVAFELLAGRPPFQGASPARLREQHLHDPAPSVRSHTPDTGAALDKLIARMLEKRPADRPGSVKDLARLLDLMAGPQAPLGETVRD